MSDVPEIFLFDPVLSNLHPCRPAPDRPKRKPKPKKKQARPTGPMPIKPYVIEESPATKETRVFLLRERVALRKLTK